MFARPVVAFDIETIPDPDLGRRHFGLEGDDAAVIRRLLELRRAETDGQSEYPQLPWQRVVCVCATILGAHGCEVRHLGGAPLDEPSHLRAFYELVRTHDPLLVSWNGEGFDLPVLRYRAMASGVAAPGFHTRAPELHLDLMDELCSHGASRRAGLAAISALLGLPSKQFAERPVHEHFMAGEHDLVIEYCKLDTIDTLLAYLAYVHHTGALSAAELSAAVSQVRTAVARERHPGWAPIAAALAHWPAWGR